VARKRCAVYGLVALAGVACACGVQAQSAEPELVHFRSGDLTLGGELFKPPGNGPFKAVLFNHGSAPDLLNSQASRAIGPWFVRQGWVFFMPYRRGQGWSREAGPFIGDELASARRQGGLPAASAALSRLMAGDHLTDQLAARAWLQAQPYVMPSRVAALGNSFGGIQTLLGVAAGGYCAAAAGSVASESWAQSPELQALLKDAARQARAPLFLFQARNDHDLAPHQSLLMEVQRTGHPAESRVYPAFGTTARQGHAFAYQGVEVWFADVFGHLDRSCP
jgi:carboxymethylenebutenolidase